MDITSTIIIPIDGKSNDNMALSTIIGTVVEH